MNREHWLLKKDHWDNLIPVSVAMQDIHDSATEETNPANVDVTDPISTARLSQDGYFCCEWTMTCSEGIGSH
jgi:hypothetical protein